MMAPVARVEPGSGDALHGRVVLAPRKAFWNTAMLLGAVVLAPLTFQIDALIMFIVLTYITLLLGHSVGMHRRLIHKTYRCKKPLEYCLVYLGVLVGMAGPSGVIRIHDLRDWAQRQRACHDYFAHRRALPIDLIWQLFCTFKFASPPQLRIEAEFAEDRFYRFLDRTWMWHQLPLAVGLYLLGGWAWLVWGVFVRVAFSVSGHWLITYFCHRPGPGHWDVDQACVQAADLPGLGWLTYGECWHNNHHAFPESARIGLQPGQADPGWWVLCGLAKLGWVWSLGEPRPISARDDLLPRDTERIAAYPAAMSSHE